MWVISRKTDESRDYATDVLAAVNLGDDTDTVGAVTGGLAGIIYGFGENGEKWLEKLRNLEKRVEAMESRFEKLYTKERVGGFSGFRTEQGTKFYVNAIYEWNTVFLEYDD